MPTIHVTLTAFNEARNIGPILDGIYALDIPGWRNRTLVVDDGSRDETQGIARDHGAEVVRLLMNLGQGHALLVSFQAALARAEDRDVIIEMDADGQHDPRFIPDFIKRLEQTGADIVVGSRILGSNHANAPFFRRTFLPHYTALINRVTGYAMTDSMCGFRAFRAGSLRRVSRVMDDMLEPQYIAAEMFIRFAKAGLTVEEIPIALADRFFGTSRKGFIRYGMGVLNAIVKTKLDKNYRRQRPI
ncbi:MAG TPA: glycosyltransferase family 2 protein [Desulfonatronum sp.]|nr:glycosyltransferase family 2 protein [Desulfonatronum sp.]